MIPFLLQGGGGSYCSGHFWIDVKTTKNQDGQNIVDVSFWPVGLQEDHEPTALCALRDRPGDYSNVILGCRDGYLRRFQPNQPTDDGTSFNSYVDYGPFPLAGPGRDGMVTEIVGITANRSGDVNWAIRTGNSAEAAFTSSAVASGTWDLEGLSYREFPRARGHMAVIRVSNGEADYTWGIEGIEIVIADAGKLRR